MGRKAKVQYTEEQVYALNEAVNTLGYLDDSAVDLGNAFNTGDLSYSIVKIASIKPLVKEFEKALKAADKIAVKVGKAIRKAANEAQAQQDAEQETN